MTDEQTNFELEKLKLLLLEISDVINDKRKKDLPSPYDLNDTSCYPKGKLKRKEDPYNL